MIGMWCLCRWKKVTSEKLSEGSWVSMHHIDIWLVAKILPRSATKDMRIMYMISD